MRLAASCNWVSQISAVEMGRENNLIQSPSLQTASTYQYKGWGGKKAPFVSDFYLKNEQINMWVFRKCLTSSARQTKGGVLHGFRRNLKHTLFLKCCAGVVCLYVMHVYMCLVLFSYGRRENMKQTSARLWSCWTCIFSSKSEMTPLKLCSPTQER